MILVVLNFVSNFPEREREKCQRIPMNTRERNMFRETFLKRKWTRSAIYSHSLHLPAGITDWCWIFVVPDCQQVINGLTSEEGLSSRKHSASLGLSRATRKVGRLSELFSSFRGESLSDMLVCPFEKGGTAESPHVFPSGNLSISFSLFFFLPFHHFHRQWTSPTEKFMSRAGIISVHDRVFIMFKRIDGYLDTGSLYTRYGWELKFVLSIQIRSDNRDESTS